jgi:hypothetical protein
VAARRALGDRARDDRGAVVAIAAIMMVSLLGMTALVVDVGYAKQYRRVAQNGADAAALAAAQDLDGSSVSTAVGRAKAYALKNDPRITQGSWSGCQDPGHLERTPDPGNSCISFTADLLTVRVALPKMEQPRFFGGVARLDPMNVGAFASARKAPGAPVAAGNCGLCVIGGRTLQIAGSTSIKVTGGEVQADSLTANANDTNNAITPVPLRWYNANNSNWGRNASGAPATFDARYSKLSAPVPNPFEGRTVNYTGLTPDYSNINFTGGASLLQPNRIYNQNVDVTSGTLNLAPGTYYFANTLNVRSGATLTGTGVTLVFSCSTACPAGEPGKFNFEAGSTVAITAPTAGTYAGMAIMFDPNGSSGTPNQLSGNVTLDGAVYGKNVGFNMGNANAVIRSWTIVAGGNFDANNGTLLIDNTKYASTIGGGAGGGAGTAGSVGLVT